jgi:predicted nucleotidyltransferase
MIRKNEIMDYLKVLENESLLETLYLFGSWANDSENPGKDLDLAAIFNLEADQERILWESRDLQSKISEDLKIPVDLIDLEMTPPYLGQMILQTGILIFCKDEERRMETTLSICRNCGDSQTENDFNWGGFGIDE